jgi:hypothetical protein
VGKVEGACALRAISSLPVAVAGAHIKGGTSAVARARVRALGGREGHDRGRDEGLDHSRRQLKGWIELIVKKRSWVSLKTVPVKLPACIVTIFQLEEFKEEMSYESREYEIVFRFILTRQTNYAMTSHRRHLGSA